MDVRSQEYQSKFLEYLNSNGKGFSSPPEEIQQYQIKFNEVLKNNGFTVVDSQPAVSNVVPQVGSPAQPLSAPALPPQQLQEAASSSIYGGWMKIGNSLIDTILNQVNNFFTGVDEVIKGTNDVMTMNGQQFLKFNDAGKEFLMQVSRTQVGALSKIPTVGTRYLEGVQNFVEDPTYYANPLNIIRAVTSSGSISAEQNVIKNLIEKLRNKNSPLHLKLINSKNAYIVQWLKDHPDIFIYYLQEENFARLANLLDNQVEFLNLKNNVEAAKSL